MRPRNKRPRIPDILWKRDCRNLIDSELLVDNIDKIIEKRENKAIVLLKYVSIAIFFLLTLISWRLLT